MYVHICIYMYESAYTLSGAATVRLPMVASASSASSGVRNLTEEIRQGSEPICRNIWKHFVAQIKSHFVKPRNLSHFVIISRIRNQDPHSTCSS